MRMAFLLMRLVNGDGGPMLSQKMTIADEGGRVRNLFKGAKYVETG